MKIYNTMTRQKEEFVPLDKNEVKIYACGPTVYNYIHIGNARPLCVFDVLRRYLEYRGYHVKFVQNFTDIDDKIIKRANEEGTTYDKISEKYIQEFWTDADGLNFKHATVHPKATENIDEIISIIQSLVEKGYAYEAGGDVYFRTLKFKEYGKLSHQPIEDLESGARIAIGEVKEDPLDFVLWKPKKEGEPYWVSPWSEGRPGWHIECSVMSKKYLGEEIDIHAGGEDLVFPHHENEIAQSEAYLGHPWCKQWFHVHHLNTNSGKMSKSKGEFLTVSLLEEKGYDPLAYRLFCLQSHYRKTLVFTWENLDNAQGTYQKLIRRVAALKDGGGAVDQEVMGQYKEKFIQQVGNDLNTSMGVTALYDVLKAKANDETKLAILRDFDQVLGLSLLEKAAALREKEAAQTASTGEGGFTITGEGDPAIDALVLQRAQAKKAKNFAEADRIRDELKAQGVEVTDTKDGAVWKRI